MAQTDYTYAVARIRFKETSLLSDSDLLSLLSSKSTEECIRMLKDRGWGDSAVSETPQEIISSEENKLWRFLSEILPDRSALSFLLVQNDFHNLKVALKAATRDEECDGMLLYNALNDPQTVVDAIKKREYDRLPDYLSEVASYAMSVLLTTSDGQLCDIVVDKACLDYVYRLKENEPNEIIRMCCELFVASSDIKIAVRSQKTGKPLDFIRRALAFCDTLNVEKLAVAASHGYEDIISYLSETGYKSVTEAIGSSMSAFEKWCDDYLIETLKPQKREPFTIGPVIGYTLGKLSEIKAVRMILSAKVNSLDESIVKERLRKSYV